MVFERIQSAGHFNLIHEFGCTAKVQVKTILGFNGVILDPRSSTWQRVVSFEPIFNLIYMSNFSKWPPKPHQSSSLQEAAPTSRSIEPRANWLCTLHRMRLHSGEIHWSAWIPRAPPYSGRKLATAPILQPWVCNPACIKMHRFTLKFTC